MHTCRAKRLVCVEFRVCCRYSAGSLDSQEPRFCIDVYFTSNCAHGKPTNMIDCLQTPALEVAESGPAYSIVSNVWDAGFMWELTHVTHGLVPAAKETPYRPAKDDKQSASATYSSAYLCVARLKTCTVTHSRRQPEGSGCLGFDTVVRACFVSIYMFVGIPVWCLRALEDCDVCIAMDAKYPLQGPWGEQNRRRKTSIRA